MPHGSGGLTASHQHSLLEPASEGNDRAWLTWKYIPSDAGFSADVSHPAAVLPAPRGGTFGDHLEKPHGGSRMRRLDVQIPTADGHSKGTLHIPEGGDGTWPGVLVLPDAGGARETFRQMGDRLASMGYVTLIPDIYYRAGEWAPFDVATLFTDKQRRARLSRLTSVLTNDRIIADSGAYQGSGTS